MIFLTIGTQLPFDRLVKAMNDLAPHLPYRVFGQIGSGAYVPQNFKFAASVTPSDFADLVSKADIVVSHAGIGTYLRARSAQKPLIMFPRIAALREHRNDHQLATARSLSNSGSVYVAENAEQLRELLNRPLESFQPPPPLNPDNLLASRLKELIL